MAEKDKDLLAAARDRMTLAISAWSETREDELKTCGSMRVTFKPLAMAC
ncbi:MAG: hypothetical protein IPG23_17535 [Burkholderiales bacterium]|nr:hypothetical protein [Burkholderiales bacterium]